MESIKQLKARYCEICDDDHNPGLITSIFTRDGVWEGEGIGRAQGHAEIRTLFKGFQKAIKFSQHMVQNPIIEIDGPEASGRWYFFAHLSTTTVTRHVGKRRDIMKGIKK